MSSTFILSIKIIGESDVVDKKFCFIDLILLKSQLYASPNVSVVFCTNRDSSPIDFYKVTLAGEGLRRRMINLRSDKMAMPVAAAVDMPVAAARSFLFSTHGSVVGNLLNSIVFKIGLVSFLPSVRSFARS